MNFQPVLIYITSKQFHLWVDIWFNWVTRFVSIFPVIHCQCQLFSMTSIDVEAMPLELLVGTAPTLIGGSLPDGMVFNSQFLHLFNYKCIICKCGSRISNLMLYQQDGLVRVRDTVLIRLDHCYLLPARGSYCVFAHSFHPNSFAIFISSTPLTVSELSIRTKNFPPFSSEDLNPLSSSM